MNKYWDEQKIIQEVKKLIELNDLKRFPTHKELDDFYGNSSLSNAISKHGGSRYFENKLGLNISKCNNTMLGEKYEEICIKDIKKHIGLDAILTKRRYPYDLLVDGNVKIDVKTSIELKDIPNCYSYNLEKRNQTCDLYVFYGLSRQTQEVLQTVIIPSCKINAKQFCISNKDRYGYLKTYKDRWDLIQKYNNFFKQAV